jgi:hypothetical protein
MATAGAEGEEVLRFEPWQSAADPGFWRGGLHTS